VASTNNIQILGLDHLVLRVRDARRMTRFYCEVLGCQVERVREEMGLTHLRAGASMIDLVAVDGELGRDGPSLTALGWAQLSRGNAAAAIDIRRLLPPVPREGEGTGGKDARVLRRWA
jgi:catechol 2,3-dioxygenase-like lactoylglutathione lyase family enzyme